MRGRLHGGINCPTPVPDDNVHIAAFDRRLATSHATIENKGVQGGSGPIEGLRQRGKAGGQP
ncbi:MAG: hypothetical protein J2P13_13055, partial [Acidobacteria bacterium]|nr:hypothetical protein [Acidobacteriota bacterium]